MAKRRTVLLPCLVPCKRNKFILLSQKKPRSRPCSSWSRGKVQAVLQPSVFSGLNWLHCSPSPALPIQSVFPIQHIFFLSELAPLLVTALCASLLRRLAPLSLSTPLLVPIRVAPTISPQDALSFVQLSFLEKTYCWHGFSSNRSYFTNSLGSSSSQPASEKVNLFTEKTYCCRGFSSNLEIVLCIDRSEKVNLFTK